ncbi:hypothetical protein NFI96_006609 [Prochilodus magdalenae]|nr:hypothetical protein NFI96_006609 [Prochilodus magdalenae]
MQLEHPHTVPADGAVGVEVEGHQAFWMCDDKPSILVLTTVPPHTDSLGVSTKTKAGLSCVVQPSADGAALTGGLMEDTTTGELEGMYGDENIALGLLDSQHPTDLMTMKNALLPAGMRQRDQTKKAPTGTFQRDNLLAHLEKQAKEHPDRDDLVPFTGEKRGKPWVPKTKVVDPILEDVTLEPELEEALANATDAELCDIADQLRNSVELHGMGFHGEVSWHPSLDHITKRSAADTWGAVV